MDILIVEDNRMTAAHLEHIVVEIAGHKVIETTDDFDKIELLLETSNIDLVLLDIHLGKEIDGVEFSENLTKKGIPFVYITTTQNDETLNRAARSEPLGFVLKPYKTRDVLTAIKLAVANIEAKNDYLELRQKGGKMKLKYDEILFIKSCNVYVEVHTEKKTYVERILLKQILKKLASTKFARIHRSFIVNKSKIEICRNKSVIIGDIEIPVSSKYLDVLTEINNK
ncbi:MAG: response regulator transcription factor [Crocinitomicaceae bacterium]|nr:response regulator transcription factor [Crocinitomicaceae bacterium]